MTSHTVVSKDSSPAPIELRRFFPDLDAPPEVESLLSALLQRLPPAQREQLDTAGLAAILEEQLGRQDAGWEAPRLRAGRQILQAYAQRQRASALFADKEQRFALTFAGQGADYYDELLDLLARQNIRARAFVKACLDALDAAVAAAPVAARVCFPHGIDPRRWTQRDYRPTAAELASSALSHPLGFVTQMGLLIETLDNQGDLRSWWPRVKAVTGHSAGLWAAVCLAEARGNGPHRSATGLPTPERGADWARVLLWQGVRMQHSALPEAPASLVAQAQEQDAGTPTCTAMVKGLRRDELLTALEALASPDLALALENGPTRHIVSGPPASLEMFRQRLVEQHAQQQRQKRQGLCGGRVPPLGWEYVPLSGPYHSPHMASAEAAMVQDCEQLGITVTGESLGITVLDTETGEPLPARGELLPRLVALSFTRPLRWPVVMRAVRERGVSWVLDFGPSALCAQMSRACLRGWGVGVTALGTAQGREELAMPRLAPVTDYTAFGLSSARYTEWTSCPPVFVPGMTPTTVEAPIVSAAANAGFVAELAGGGQVTERILRTRLDEICETLEPGRGIVFNALYLDAYLWRLHFGPGKLVEKLRREGYPILGVTISAGIPPVDEAVRLLRELNDAGLWLNALKPGNDRQLQETLAIADAAPELTLGVHIEGGKAGGHHSWEDLDDLLLRFYPALRERPQLMLCAGGGIGTEAKAVSYLTGAWSLSYGEAPMPVDAVFLGTRLMAAAEAKTSQAVKEALVNTAGTEAWVVDGASAGGITSGRSQLDATIYYCDNAAARAGRLVDEVARAPETIPSRREEIIAALNRTAKPYFGDLERMTYGQVLERALQLTATGQGGPYEDGAWPDVSYRQRFAAWVWMAEARLVEHAGRSVLPTLAHFDDPQGALTAFLQRYPHAQQQVVHTEDVRRFVEICRQPGKPVPFVPVIDGDVRRWYKSDSLGFSHDERFSADQVLTIPGPAAVSGIHKVNEPVGEILQSFTAALAASTTPRQVQLLPPEPGRWAGAHGTWSSLLQHLPPPLRRMLAARQVVVQAQPLRVADNPLRALLAPSDELEVTWDVAEDGHWCLRGRVGDEPGVEVVAGERQLQARVLLPHPREPNAERAWDLGLRWRGDALWWDREACLREQRQVFGELLFGASFKATRPFERCESQVEVRAEGAAEFALATGASAAERDGLPLQLAFVWAWEPIFSCVVGAEIDLVALVHEENQITRGAAWPPADGSILNVKAKLVERARAPGGVRLGVRALCHNAQGQEVARVESRFFVRGTLGANLASERRDTLSAELWLQDDAAREVLAGVPGLVADLTGVERARLLCHEHGYRGDGEERRYVSRGRLVASTREGEREVGHVDLDATGHEGQRFKEHPIDVAAALFAPPARATTLEEARELGSQVLRAPAHCGLYAEAGGDHNPLHQVPSVARLAGFSRPIVHGMWTASATLNEVVRVVAMGEHRRVRSITVTFSAAVSLGEELVVHERLLGVREGARRLELRVVAQREEGEVVVMRGEVEVDAPRTAFIFPGQGVQTPGMGMSAYRRSPAARAVWEEADAVCRRRFGFSLLHVVRTNPKRLVAGDAVFTHPAGVLHLTRFTQVAIVAMAVAQMRELTENGVAVRDAMFCGHSVGEYAALAALAESLSLPAVLEVVYQRGATMEALVSRDASGQSAYAMGVVRPHAAGLQEEEIHALVESVAQAHGFLQIVNYNIRGRQYAVTGEVQALQALAAALTERAIDPNRPPYIQVPGIDVPFHSSLLRPGVDAFRQTLESVIDDVEPARLVGRYIPNLVAEPFTLERAFAQRVYECCDSPRLRDALNNWDPWAQDPRGLARLLLIELLAYQFASPVRWIETQDRLLDEANGVERVIEVGVEQQPVVANMLRATLAGEGPRHRAMQVLHTETQWEELFGPSQLITVQTPTPAAPTAAPPVAPAAEQAPAATPAPTPAPAPAAAPAGPVQDRPVLPSHALWTLLALQAKVRPEQIDARESLDDLLGGNSARRNQVLADVGAELAIGAVDGAHEMPLQELATQVDKRAPRYRFPGPYLRGHLQSTLARLFGPARLAPENLSAYLEQEWELGAGHINGVMSHLLLAARAGDSHRGGALGSLQTEPHLERTAALNWLDRVVQSYGAQHGLPLGKRVAQTGAAVVDGAALQDLEDRLWGPQGVLTRTADALGEGLGRDTHPGQPVPMPATDPSAEALKLYQGEHGDTYLRAVTPIFDADKHVAFTSAWAWARRDLWSFAYGDEPWSAAELTALSRRLDRTSRKMALRLAHKIRQRGDTARAEALEHLGTAEPKPGAVLSFVPRQPWVDASGAYSERARPGEESAQAMWEKLDALGLTLDRESGAYRAALGSLLNQGVSFAGRTALVTGASPRSIAWPVVGALLAGGARVICTTTSYTTQRLQQLQALYQSHACPGAELHVVPVNQGSRQDVERAVEWIGRERRENVSGVERILKTAWEVDLLLPFAALGDLGDLTTLTDRSLAAARVLLHGVEQWIGSLSKQQRSDGPRLQVVLPLSPNHGIMGGDGVYGETKAALETLLNRWRAEQAAWGANTSLIGARIGWVRGTGLMEQNDLIAARLEVESAVRTFSTEEMGWLLAGLCCRSLERVAREAPLVADLTGGLGQVDNLQALMTRLRGELEARDSQRKRVQQLNEQLGERAFVQDRDGSPVEIKPRANVEMAPPMPTEAHLEQLPPLDHLDPHEAIVVVGFGEVSPWGSARTRWALEQTGELSLEAAVELAWMMGLIVPRAEGAGWAVAEDGAPIEDLEVKARFEETILSHCGIRWVEPELQGFDPNAAVSYLDVHLERDFAFPVPSGEVAESLRNGDPENTEVRQASDGTFTVIRKRGATVRVRRALRIDRTVAGQIPTGWDPKRYGISAELERQVDRTTLFNLVATAEAFMAAGLQPEEMYAFLHPARVGSTQGSGIGGMRQLERLFRDFYEGRERQNDTIQETLINVITGYVVQSYLGSYGPMSFPVAACATAAVSVADAWDKLRSGAADFVVAGAVDDYSEEGAIGFGDMAATASADEMTRLGIEPRGFCRPNDRRRRGFVEAQGAGAVLLCRASLALEAGLPVYGVLIYAGSFGDGINRSVPAPGLGALACVSEAPHELDHACDFAARRARVLEAQAREGELSAVLGEAHAREMLAEMRRKWGHDFYRGRTDISPLRGALGVWGLEANDIGVVSKHDTSTQANDLNENRLHGLLQEQLGRCEAEPLAVISQKSLTGHGKGPAAAWQMIGLLQAMGDGVIPGNRSLQDVDPAMEALGPFVFSDRTLPAGCVRAGLVTSLGFGHVSSVICLGEAGLFWRLLTPSQRRSYSEKLRERLHRANGTVQSVTSGAQPLFQVRTVRPFAGKDGSEEQRREEVAMLLNPSARLQDGTFRQVPT